MSSFARGNGKQPFDEFELKGNPSLTKRIAGLEVGVFLYYLAFALYVIAAAMLTTYATKFGYAFVGRVMFGFKLAACLLLVTKIVIFQRQSLLQWLIIVVLGLLGYLSSAVTGDLTMLALVLFVAAAKGADYRVLACIVLIANIGVLAVAVVGCQAGLLDNFTMARDGAVGARSAMGFTHPNFFGLCLTSACVALFVLRGNRIGLVEAFAGIACCWTIYEISDSRTAILGIILAYALLFVSAHLHNRVRRRAFCSALVLAVAVVVLLSLYLMAFFDPSVAWQAKLNQLLSTRFYWGHYYFSNYPPGLLGQDVDLLPTMYFNGGGTTTNLLVDNAYERLCIRYGPVVLAVLLMALLAFFCRGIKYGAYGRGVYGIVFVGMTFAAIYGFAERVFIQPEFNYFMVIGFSWLLYGFPKPEGLSEHSGAISRSSRKKRFVNPLRRLEDMKA